MNHRLLVTGGCGFIGARLVKRLVEQGHRVSVIDDLRAGSPKNLPPEVADEIELSAVNLEDAERTRDVLQAQAPEAIYHLAAIHFLPACNRDPHATVAANVSGTQSLLDACASLPSLQGLVLASTAAVYAPASEPHCEDGALGPTDIYGHTKLWNEQQAVLFQSSRANVGVAIARLFNVFGPGETSEHLIPAILVQALGGDTVNVGNLDTYRDYVFIDDAVEALVRVADKATTGGLDTYNIGSEREYDGHAVLDAVGRILGRAIRPIPDDARRRTNDRPHLLSDCSRARADLGWRAGVSLEEGLRRAAEQPLAPGSAGRSQSSQEGL